MNKKLIIRGSLLLAIVGVTAAAIPFAFMKNDTFTEAPAYKNNATPIPFNENLIEIKKETIYPPENDFLGDQPWIDLPSNASDPIYADIYTSIDNQIIANDIKQWLIDLSTVNKAFQINVQDINVKQLTRAIDAYKIDINFQIYNNSATRKLFSNDSMPYSYGIGAYEIANNHVSLDTNFIPTLHGFDDYAMAGYEFDQATWAVSNKVFSINNFSFSDYSKTLNTKISNVSVGNGYLDIKEQGEQYLSNLTADIITKQIIDEQAILVKTIVDNIEPAQKILQSYVKNPGLKDFLNSNAQYIVDIITNLIPDVGGFDLTSINQLLIDVLQNKKITEIMVHNKSVLINLLSMLDFDLSGFIPFIEGATEADYDNLLRSLVAEGGLLGDLVTDELIAIVNNLLDKGMIDFIIDSGLDLITFIDTMMPGIVDSVSFLGDIFALIQKGGSNQPIVNLTVDLIHANDSSGKNILTSLLEMLLPGDLLASFGPLLDQVLISNSNLSVGNLQTALGALANPVNAKKGSTVKSYSEFFNKMTITQEIIKKSYDPITHMPDIEIKFGFKFNDTLWINLGNVFKILPPNISLDGTSIPLSLIVGVAPDWVGLFSNDYVSDDRVLNEQLHYDVVKNSDGNDVLSWQASQTSAFDVNLPLTVKSLWDSSTIGTGNLILHFAENFMYHKYYNHSQYKPSLIYKSEIVQDYNPNKKNGQSLSFNTLTSEQMAQLSALVTGAMQTVQTGDSYSWKYLWTNYKINKSITKNNADVNYLLSQFIKANNINHADIPLYIEFNSDYIIRETKFVFFTIPNVINNNLGLWTPANVYSDQGMSSNWSFGL